MSSKSIDNEEFFANVKEIISSGESVRINLKGRSMDPTFKDGKDVVVISPFRPEDIAPGDVVLFDRKDTICLHRVIKRKDDKLVIRGDGNSFKSLEFARISDVIAVVTSGTMHGGRPFTVQDAAWKRNTKRIFRFFPLLALGHWLQRIFKNYYLSIITLCLLLYLSFVNLSKFPTTTLPNADKYVHFTMYTCLSLVFWFEWLKLHLKCYRRQIAKGVFFCVIFPIMIGIMIELGQEYLTVYRYGDVFDALANASGTLFATLLSFAFTLPVLKHKMR